MADYSNRFSLWARATGPVTHTGTLDINGTEYNLKFLRLAKEDARGALIVELREGEQYVTVGSGFLYPAKFEDMLLSGKLTVRDAEYYVNFYRGKSGGGPNSPVFSGNVKPVGAKSAPRATAQDGGDSDDW